MTEKQISDRKTSAKDALMAVAAKLFTEKGYEAVSTRELAEAAGVNLGAIQYHFGSKAKLFVATLRQMMPKNTCSESHVMLNGECRTKEQAALLTARFVRSFLGFLLLPKGPQPCRLMFREILSDSARDEELSEALVSTYVEQFIEPLETDMRRVLTVLDPEAGPDELARYSRSIVAQCAFYVTHRPFIERLQGESILDPALFDSIVEHICRFSLRGMKCRDELIDRVLEEEAEASVTAEEPQRIASAG